MAEIPEGGNGIPVLQEQNVADFDPAVAQIPEGGNGIPVLQEQNVADLDPAVAQIPEGGNANPAPQDENVADFDPAVAQIPEGGNGNPAPQEENVAEFDPAIAQIPEDGNANPAPQEENVADFDPAVAQIPGGNANPPPQEENAVGLDPALVQLGFQLVPPEDFNLPALEPVEHRDLDIDDEDIVDGQNLNMQAVTNHILKAPRLMPGMREIAKLKGSIIEPNRYLCIAGDAVTEYNLIIPEGFMLNNLLADGAFVVISIREDANGEKIYILHRLIENNLVVRHYMYRGEWPQNAVFHVNF